MQNFKDLKTGDRFTLNAAPRPDADWIEVRTVKAPGSGKVLFEYSKPAKNGQTSAVFGEADYDWHVKNGQILPLEIDPAEALALTRATLNAAKATIDRQGVRIAELEAENATLRARLEVPEAKADADADTAQIRLLKRYVRHAEMAVMGPEDADEEGGQ